MAGFRAKGRRSGNGRARPEGFTLIELLVVLTILGLAATAVVIAIPDPGGGLAAEAERFAARAKAARDSALVDSRAAAVRIGEGGYEVEQRSDGEWRGRAAYEWISGTQPELAGGEMRIVFDPTGLADPLHLVLRRGDERANVEIANDGSIAVRR